ncbi:hypothetical protein NM688_g4340 [Phlebia brevispora]|uniref:Uncharacterized protein n=1 Tax=Phlebia brevispora TaxID=194682 RepID=A0ACC1T367_9APHY|nr:hypothetical protein NM688_g4340 [Phlebia brevispora]
MHSRSRALKPIARAETSRRSRPLRLGPGDALAQVPPVSSPYALNLDRRDQNQAFRPFVCITGLDVSDETRSSRYTAIKMKRPGKPVRHRRTSGRNRTDEVTMTYA